MAETLPRRLWQEIDLIDGWLTYEEADQLYRLCEGIWCEVGSWKGKSTIVLSKKHRGYAIDWFKGSSEHGPDTDTLDEFTANLKKFSVTDNVTIIPEKYQDALKKVGEPLQLLFLDAEHTYEATKEAFELYEPLVEQGGIIILHDVWGWMGEKEDTPWPGVTKFARELLKNKRFKHLEDARRSMAVVKL